MWDAGFRITACAATPFQAALVLSIPKRSPPDETQETLRTSMFPSTHVKVSNRLCFLMCEEIDNLALGVANAPVPCRTNGTRTFTSPGLPTAAQCAERQRQTPAVDTISFWM